MKINELYQPLEEISLLSFAKKSMYTAKELDEKWKEIKDNADIYETKLLSGIDVAIVDIGGSKEVYLLNVAKRNRPVAYLQLAQKGKGWQTVMASVRDSAMGMGLGYKIYVILIKEHDMMLVSDEQQSAGGAKIWQKLFNTTGINVYGWDPAAAADKQFFQVHDLDDTGTLDAVDRRLYNDPDENISKKSSNQIAKKELDDQRKASPRLLVAIKGKR